MKDFSFSHRTHRSYRALLRTVSIPQKASGIQNSQNVTANEDTNKEAKSSLHPVHRGISVITPLPFGGGVGGGAAIFIHLCVSVLLCNSVRNRTHPLYEITHKQLTGEFYLSRRTFLSLTELTDLTEPICVLFRSHRRPPAYRIHRTLLLFSILKRDILKPTSSP